MHTLTYVSNDDDWQGFYIDGNLAIEDHYVSGLNLAELLADMGIISPVNRICADDEWLGEVGRLPDNLKEVVEFQNNPYEE